MRVPAFRPAPYINLDEFERRLQGEGAQRAGSENPPPEWGRLAESSSHSPSSPSRSCTIVPGQAKTGGEQTGGESTRPFDVGTLSPSDETNDNWTKTTAVDPEASQTNGVGDLQAWGPGLAEEVTERRSPSWKVIVTAVTFAAIATAGSVLVGAPIPPKKPPIVAATDGPTEVVPPNDETVAASGNADEPLMKDSARLTQDRVVKEQPGDLSRQPSLGSAPPPAGATADLAVIQPAAELSAAPVAPTVDTSAVAAPAAPPPTQSPYPKPVRAISVRPDGTPIASPASSVVGSIEVSSSEPAAEAPAAEASEVTRHAVETTPPLISRPDSSTKRLGKTPAGSVVAKADATGLDTRVVARSEPISPGTPAKPEKEAGAPNSAHAAAEADAAPSPAEDAKRSFDRVLHTFGSLFSARTPPASQPDPTAAALAGWAVQLAAPKSEAEAKSDLTRLNAKYASALNGSTIDVRKVIVNGDTVYRLRVVDLSKKDAAALCARLKEHGGNCFIAAD